MSAASHKRLGKFLSSKARRGRGRRDTRNRIFGSRLDVRGDARKWEVLAPQLEAGAKASLLIPNAGGTSVRSEALSIDVLERFFGASGVLCEMEVQYDGHPWSMVDYLATIRGQRVGVSVFRAMVGPKQKRCEFSLEDAERLVRKKLHGLVVARDCMSKAHRFHKCILHCIAQSPAAGRMMEAALRAVQRDFEPELAAVVTVVRRFDDIFYEPSAAAAKATAAAEAGARLAAAGVAAAAGQSIGAAGVAVAGSG